MMINYLIPFFSRNLRHTEERFLKNLPPMPMIETDIGIIVDLTKNN